MAQINVSNLTFGYEGSYDTIFENVSFSIDTSWKLGFVGRNGKGKTTFLQLLLGKYEYQGAITRSVVFDYFPYPVKQKDLERTAAELMEDWKAGVESWRVLCELEKVDMDAELLYRPFGTLSFGERTRVMLAVLFSGENDFLLIDEPTNHLDQDAREIIKKYLASKKGFILVSHDRDLLDACIDHVLVLNRASIEVQSGNFSSWWENKEKADHFARMEHEKRVKEIGKLKAAADCSSRWAEKNENTKIGYDPAKEHDRSISTRSYIGAKTKKMQSRVKAYEERMDREIEKKEGLLKDIETVKDLKIMPLSHYKERLIECRTQSRINPRYFSLPMVTFSTFSGSAAPSDAAVLSVSSSSVISSVSFESSICSDPAAGTSIFLFPALLKNCLDSRSDIAKIAKQTVISIIFLFVIM